MDNEDLPPHLEIFGSRQVPGQRWALDRSADPAKDPDATFPEDLAEDMNRPFLLAQQPQHQPQRRCLSRSVGTEEPVDASGCDFEIDVAQPGFGG